MLNKSLPFYGRKGSINELKETEKNYNVSTYNIEGKKNQNTMIIKKTTQNKNELLKSYYKDVKEYLKTNNEKYENAIHIKDIDFPNTKLIEIIFILSIVLAIAPLTTALIGMTSLMTAIYSLAVGIPFSIAATIILKKIEKQDKKNKFIKEYSNLNKEYVTFYSENKNVKNTKSQEIKPINRNKENNYKYIKERKKSNIN